VIADHDKNHLRRRGELDRLDEVGHTNQFFNRVQWIF
jgi:hypothetical protein